MATTFATLVTPQNGVGAATALSTIGPATFMLANATSARPLYILEVSVDGATFKPLARLAPGQPLTVQNVPFVSCRMRVVGGETGVTTVVGYTTALASQGVSAGTLAVGQGGQPGAPLTMPANQTVGKILVVNGSFDGSLTLEGALSNGVFVPILQLTFKNIDEFSITAFTFTGIFQQLRLRLAGSGTPSVQIGASTDTGSGSGIASQIDANGTILTFGTITDTETLVRSGLTIVSQAAPAAQPSGFERLAGGTNFAGRSVMNITVGHTFMSATSGTARFFGLPDGTSDGLKHTFSRFRYPLDAAQGFNSLFIYGSATFGKLRFNGQAYAGPSDSFIEMQCPNPGWGGYVQATWNAADAVWDIFSGAMLGDSSNIIFS